MIRRDLDFFPMSSEASFAYGNCSLDSEESLLRAHLLVQGQYEGFNGDHNGVFFTASLVSFPGICCYNYGSLEHPVPS